VLLAARPCFGRQAKQAHAKEDCGVGFRHDVRVTLVVAACHCEVVEAEPLGDNGSDLRRSEVIHDAFVGKVASETLHPTDQLDQQQSRRAREHRERVGARTT
jgi:hypothetical protein